MRQSAVVLGLAGGLVLSVATCRDAVGPNGAAVGRVAIAPILPSAAALADFGLTIDAVRFIVVRHEADTIADTTLAFPPDATELELDLRVPLVAASETLSVSVVALSGTIPLFSGTRLVPVPSPIPPTEIPVDTYVGPPADSVVIQPRNPFILLNDSLRFQVQGFNQGVPVTQFYVAWSSSDSGVAPINRFGVLRAPATRAAVHVRARTPSGASDSVLATFVPPATQLVAVAGGGQTGTVGTPLVTPLEVETRATDGLGVGGVSVRFRPLVGGGAVTDTAVVTDGAGRARTTVTLGSVVGAQSFEASATGLGGSPISFDAAAFAGRATQIVATAGDLQSAVVGTAVATDPAVRAEDQFGNPVPGASITFAVSGGGGSVTGPTQLTTATGIATVGSWTLGTVVGANTLTATVAGLTPVTFTATGIAGAATQIAQLAGNGQAAVVNTILPTAPAVIVRDQFNNPVPGVGVSFAPASGGGTVTGALQTTDPTGVATVGSWRLGVLAGQNTLTASASGLAGSPVMFTATGMRDVAAQLLRMSVDTQTAIAGQPVSTPPVVRVADQFGNSVPGASVTFTLTGALIGTVTPSTATTDSLGVARVTNWTLAAGPGLNTLDAAASGLVGSPITFSANGITTTATNMALGAGDLQSGIVATLLPIPYSVVVKDAAGLPVQNVQVHWAAGPAGGSMNPATSPTDVNGIAASMRTLGPVAGTQTATASVGGLAGSPVPFTATALPDAPTQLVKQSADSQAATVATAVVAPIVKVADRFGNGVAGVVVNFAVTAGGGIVGATADTTDGLGLATAGSWTLGNVAGTNTVTVTAGALPAVTFTATGVAGAAARLAFVTDPTRALAGDTIEPAVQVAVQDQFGNTVFPAKDVVTLGLGATPDPAAKLVGTVDAAAFNGVAVFPNLAIDSAGAGYTLLAAAVNLTGAESKPFDIGGVIGAIPVTRLGPVAAALNVLTKRLYVPGSSAVSVLDIVKNAEVVQLSGFEVPFGVAVNGKTDQIYVSSAAGVVVIDGPSNTTRVSIPVGTGAKGIAVDEATNQIYVAVAGDPQKGVPALVPIDGAKDAVISTAIVALPGAGVGVAFNPNTGLVYVAIPTLQEVAVVDPVKAAVVAEIRGLGKGSYGVAVDVRTNLLYVTNRDENTVSVIDPAALKEIARLPVGRLPEGLGVDPNRGIVYVGNSGESTVSLIDGGKFNVFATLILGPTATLAPKAAVVEPATGRVYVPTQLDDLVRVIQP